MEKPEKPHWRKWGHRCDPGVAPSEDRPSCRAAVAHSRTGCLSQQHSILTATALPPTKHRSSCLLLRKPTLTMQVLIKGKELIQGPATWKVGDSCLKAHLLGQWGTDIPKPIFPSQWRQRLL